jgi:DNA-binding NarL/FixJ family response regulator
MRIPIIENILFPVIVRRGERFDNKLCADSGIVSVRSVKIPLRENLLERSGAAPRSYQGTYNVQPEREVVGVYSDRELLRWALERIADREFRFEAMPRAAAAEGGGHEVLAGLPSVIIVDLQNGVFESIRTLSDTLPGVPIVVWQRSSATEPSLNALDWGAAGVLHDSSAPAEVLACLKSVREGSGWVPLCVAQAASRSRRCHLSRREGQLLRLVVQGLRNKEIAYALNISEGTVKVYFSKLFQKLGVSDRYELAMLGLRHCGPDSMLSDKDPKHPGGYEPLSSIYIHKSTRWGSVPAWELTASRHSPALAEHSNGTRS